MWIGSLALAGVPIFAGYYSKDAILEAAWASHGALGGYAFWMGLIAAFLTAFYSWRLLFLAFHGEPRMDHHAYEHVHESPRVMRVPLVVLAVGVVVAGFLGHGMIEPEGEFWAGALFMRDHPNILEELHHVPFLVVISPLIMDALGIGLAYVLYVLRPELPGRIAGAARPAYEFLLNKWYFDELYDAVFVRPARALGLFFWRGGDQAVIDRFGPDGVAAGALATARRAVRLQTGYVYHYAFAMLIGVAALVTWYLLLVPRG